MRATLDLRSQLADRYQRLRSLIEFINANGALGHVSVVVLFSLTLISTVPTHSSPKLSQSSRQQLAQDAEKLSSAKNLWHYHNQNHSTQVSYTPLPKCAR